MDVPKKCPAAVSEIMKACLKFDPKERITFPEISDKLAQLVDQDLQKQSETSPDQSRAVKHSESKNASSDDPVRSEKEGNIEKSETDTQVSKLDDNNYLILFPTVTTDSRADFELRELKKDGNWMPGDVLSSSSYER